MADYKSSVHEMNFFLGGHVWDDMQNDFEQWLEGVRDQMEQSDSERDLWRCQGRAEAMRFVLQWADNILDILKEETEE
jgi:hypothetical protein